LTFELPDLRVSQDFSRRRAELLFPGAVVAQWLRPLGFLDQGTLAINGTPIVPR
jgi:hypothetical protein